MTRQVTPLPNIEPILRWAFLGAIVIATVGGVIVGETSTASLEGSTRTILPLILFAVGVSWLIIVRYRLLPSMATKPEVLPQALASLGYGFAEAPATFGLVSAIVTGQGWVALPFGALALLGWAVVRASLAQNRAAAAEDFPRL